MLALCMVALLGAPLTSRALYLTTTNIQGTTPGSWLTANDWQTNTAAVGAGVPGTQTGPKVNLSVVASAGSAVPCEVIGSGVIINTAVAATTVPMIRTPSAASTFPGQSLTLNTNTILFYKGGNNQIDFYTNLVLKGGVLVKALGGAASTAIITGAVQVVSQSFLSSGTTSNRLAVPSTSAEVFNIAGALSGSGNLYIMDFITNSPNIISGGNNNLGYHGTFVVQCGALLGTNVGSLGTNSSVIVDPNNTLYKADMPNVNTTINGLAVFDVAYAYNTSGTLTLTNNGLMNLRQHCAFGAVTINGTPLTAGDHTYTELAGNFPGYFFPGGSDLFGSITVQPYNPNWSYGVPVFIKQPESLSLYAGGMVHFSASANSATGYQWLSNNVPLTGATNNTLTYNSPVTGVNYSLVANNNNGAVTSSVVTVSIRTPSEPYETAVANLGPYAFYQLNETSNAVATAGGATAFDNANSLNGLYGTAALNAFNSVAGPAPANGLPGFNTLNGALQPQNPTTTSTVTAPALNLNTNSVTIAAWIYPNATQLSAAGLVVCRGATTVAGLAYTTFFNGDYSLGYVWNNEPNSYNWDSQLHAPVNQWSLVAVTVTPTNATVFVFNTNGVASARHDNPHLIQSFKDPITIGGDSLSGARIFSGIVDDAVVFNKALTRDQLLGMFYAASGVTNYPPIIATAPTNQSVYAGQTATFTVAGGGSHPLTYQWQADDGLGNFTNLVNGGQISGATNQTLTINNATNVNAVNYQVILANAWGSVTSTPPANLIVNAQGAPMNITASAQQATGANWDSTGFWNDGLGGFSATASAAGYPGSTYELLAGSRLRTPTTAVNATFPGVQLTLDGNGVWTNNAGAGSSASEIRIKITGSSILNYTLTFPKLIMNGGQIDIAPDGTPAGNIILAGEMDILTNAPIYNDGTGGDNLGVNLTAWLTGNGNGSIEYHGDTAGSIPFNTLTNNLNITCTTNTFTGRWTVASGVLLASAPGSLSTNTITVGSPTGTNAALETSYDLNSTNANLVLWGKMYLHQNDAFKSVFINGAPLTAGTYSIATLNSNYPANFPTNWALQNGSTVSNASGSITVLSTPAPFITAQPQSLTLYPGQAAATFSITAIGNTPFSYRWFTNGTTALSDNVNRIGSTSNILTIPNPSFADAGNYTVVVTNSFGAATSSVATLTILTPGASNNYTLDLGGIPVVLGVGNDWNTTNSWNPDGQAASVSKYSNPGSTYEVVVGSRLRTPAGTNYIIFPGDQLTVDGGGVWEDGTLAGVGELRFKNTSLLATNYFKKLVLNGGQLDNGANNGSDALVAVIQGQMDVTSSSTIYVGATALVDRGYQIDSWLTGAGNLFWHQFSGGLGGVNLQVTGTSNTFSGQWTVDQGALVGVGLNCLGTNNITVGGGTNIAALETLYNINNPAGALILGQNGQVFLHQNDRFASVTINGTPLTDGTYSFAQLNAAYPLAFPATWTLQAGSSVTNGSGQIIVGNVVTPPSPRITGIQVSGTTLSLSATNGLPSAPWVLLQSTNIALPFSQWQTNTTGGFDGSGNLSTNILSTATNRLQFYILKVQ